MIKAEFLEGYMNLSSIPAIDTSQPTQTPNPERPPTKTTSPRPTDRTLLPRVEPTFALPSATQPSSSLKSFNRPLTPPANRWAPGLTPIWSAGGFLSAPRTGVFGERDSSVVGRPSRLTDGVAATPITIPDDEIEPHQQEPADSTGSSPAHDQPFTFVIQPSLVAPEIAQRTDLKWAGRRVPDDSDLEKAAIEKRERSYNKTSKKDRESLRILQSEIDLTPERAILLEDLQERVLRGRKIFLEHEIEIYEGVNEDRVLSEEEYNVLIGHYKEKYGIQTKLGEPTDVEAAALKQAEDAEIIEIDD